MPSAIDRLYRHLLQAIDPPPAEARRLFHGRGRCWPGLEQITADWLQDVLLVSLFKEPAATELQHLRQCLLQLTDTPVWLSGTAKALLLQHRYRRENSSEWLWGTPVEQLVIEENGLRFLLDLGNKQNTGLFLDMRNGRAWVREQAHGRRVLNLFAYTCGFSVAALAGGAEQVTNLDMAKAALSRGRENHRLNGQALDRVRFLPHELLRSWGNIRRQGPYDLIIIDPPSFQKGSFDLQRDYRKILRRLPELLAERGQVLACINDPETSSTFLQDSMAVEAPDLIFEYRLENPAEFIDIDKERALKALVFRLSAP